MRFVCILWMCLMALGLQAQDFTTKFHEECKQSTALRYVTVGPKMMEAAVKEAAKKGQSQAEIGHIMTQLTSMQIVTAKTGRTLYYNKAKALLQNNPNRFVPYSSYKGKNVWRTIHIRKQGDKIAELVMLALDKKTFTLINFTGQMDEKAIMSLARMMGKRS